MAIGEKDVTKILEWFEASSWEEMRLESGGIRLSVSKTGRSVEARAGGAGSGGGGHARAFRDDRDHDDDHERRGRGDGRERERDRDRSARDAGAPPPKPEEAPVDPSWVAVRSPTLGNFYVAPAPGAPPFVTVGQAVSEDDTVAIVEVMKLMNHVKAGARGTIARVAAKNGELVEFEQPLFWIDPSGGGAR